MPKAKKPSARPRRKMVKAPEEVQRWSALLSEEIVSWPEVRAKHMFGFLAYYRGDVLFGILPRTRGFDSGRLVILKFDPMPPKLFHRAERDPRLGTWTRFPRKGWFTFELTSEDDLRDALWWLQHACSCANKTRSVDNQPRRSERVNRAKSSPRTNSPRSR
jgi:hypothetical protein